MLDFRLKSLEIMNRMGIPNWILDISGFRYGKYSHMLSLK